MFICCGSFHPKDSRFVSFFSCQWSLESSYLTWTQVVDKLHYPRTDFHHLPVGRLLKKGAWFIFLFCHWSIWCLGHNIWRPASFVLQPLRSIAPRGMICYYSTTASKVSRVLRGPYVPPGHFRMCLYFLNSVTHKLLIFVLCAWGSDPVQGMESQMVQNSRHKIGLTFNKFVIKVRQV